MDWKSTFTLSLFCSLIVFSWLIVVEAHPADNKDIRSSDDPLAFSSNELPNETPKTENKNELTRNKRTVGFLRQLFPGLSQILDRKIQQITRILFRVVGRLILRGGGDGNGGGSSDSDANNRKISITLPTYPPSDDEEEDTQAPTEKDIASTDLPSLDVRTSNSSSNDSSSNSGSSSDSGTASGSTSSEAPESNMIVRKSRDVSDVLSADTTLSPLDDEASSSTTESTTKRGGLLSLISRSRRGSLLGNGSSGGSGNFVFDLIRLIAGSGTTPEKDEELNAPREERDDDAVDNADANDVNNGVNNTPYNPDEDTGGIPGPLTRFALLVNRGIGNIVKDIILRIAQTGERIVNYKARLITAII